MRLQALKARCERARPHLRGVCSQPQMDCRLHVCVDSGGLALCGCCYRSLLPARCRLVDERCDDSTTRHRRPSDGDLATRSTRCVAASFDRGSQYTSEQFQKLMADHGVVCSMSRSGNVWDNAAMESFFSSLKTERIRRKTYRTRDEARADVFDYIERFYNPKRRHSTIGYLSPMEFESQVGLVSKCHSNRVQATQSTSAPAAPAARSG